MRVPSFSDVDDGSGEVSIMYVFAFTKDLNEVIHLFYDSDYVAYLLTTSFIHSIFKSLKLCRSSTSFQLLLSVYQSD